ncbi:SGNH/GDSL hydrolase family protein [Sulfitobacter noctilucae]|uniref:SGNH/GDSL hydrolase family protein n=1 Tax=Sulfitobacter noctilucae TaxID=1342302 RepID=UPI001F4C7605|nr:SGNH/GDSL hydrolase family protein [Sulfitobacter noctilucae]
MLGDSIMAWNGSNAIPDVIERTLNRQVISRAVSGAQFDNASRLAGAVGFDIQRQYPGGSWNWIVLDGGANDLGFGDCGCGNCTAAVDRLIAADAASGLIPSFITRMRAESGAQVIWMGYYAGNGKGSFKGCRDDLVRMEARIARFAAATPGVQFIDSEDVIDPADPTVFASDNTHPSVKGSALIGTYLAQAIAKRSQSAD